MQQEVDKQTVVILPESDGPTLCIKNVGLVSAADHRKYLRNQLQRLKDEYGYFNLLVHYDDSYKGYTAEAADASIRSMIDFGKCVRKLAYVNPPETRILLHKVLPDVFKGEVRFFNEFPRALDWIKE